jgi:hypothetical protein
MPKKNPSLVVGVLGQSVVKNSDSKLSYLDNSSHDKAQIKSNSVRIPQKLD